MAPCIAALRNTPKTGMVFCLPFIVKVTEVLSEPVKYSVFCLFSLCNYIPSLYASIAMIFFISILVVLLEPMNISLLFVKISEP